MVTLLAIILITSFIGFQVPVICTLISTSKIDALCAATLKQSRQLQETGGAIKIAFHKSAEIK